MGVLCSATKAALWLRLYYGWQTRLPATWVACSAARASMSKHGATDSPRRSRTHVSSTVSTLTSCWTRPQKSYACNFFPRDDEAAEFRGLSGPLWPTLGLGRVTDRVTDSVTDVQPICWDV